MVRLELGRGRVVARVRVEAIVELYFSNGEGGRVRGETWGNAGV